MESDLKRGIEIRKSIRLPTKRMAPAPPMRDGTGDSSNFAAPTTSSKPEPPPTSLRQLLGDKPTAAVEPPPQPMMEVSGSGGGSASASASSSSVDKRQLAVRTDGGGIGAVAAPTKLVVDDGVHELNLKNLRIATTTDNDRAQNKVISELQKTTMAPPPVITARKMAPLSPSLVRKITTLHQDSADKVSGSRAVPGAATAGHPIKLSDLDSLVTRRDYVNQEVVGPAVSEAGKRAIPEDLPLTSIDVLNQIQQQITNMEVKHHEQTNNSGEQAVENSMENVAHYKERIKMSKRYGEKEELSLKHGRSDVASNQLLGYLGDYRDNVRPNTGADGEIDHSSEDESAHSPFQRGSSVRKSTGGAVSMAKTTMAGGTTHGKGKPVSRTASDTKNLETKIKMMRETAANHGPIDSKPPTARRAKPVTTKLPFSFKPRILDMNEKHLVHQVTPPSTVTAVKPIAGQHIEDHHHHHQQQSQNASTRTSHSPSVQPRVQSVQSHSKKLEQVMFMWGPQTSV